MKSEFVRTMRTEDKFELEENGVSLARREEIVRVQKIVIVLQAQLGKLCRIPGDVA
jgi:hypothetical protein